MTRLLQGLGIWGLGLALALNLPGSAWKAAAPPAFPWAALGPAALATASLALFLTGFFGTGYTVMQATLTYRAAPPAMSATSSGMAPASAVLSLLATSRPAACMWRRQQGGGGSGTQWSVCVQIGRRSTNSAARMQQAGRPAGRQALAQEHLI